MGVSSSAASLVAGFFALIAGGAISLLLARLTAAGPPGTPLGDRSWRALSRRGGVDSLPVAPLGVPAPTGHGPRGTRSHGAHAAGGPVAFLFEDGRLVDATPAARRLIRGLDRREGDQLAILRLLSARFGPDLPDRVARLPEEGRLCLAAPGGDDALEASAEEGTLRLVLDLDDPEAALARLAFDAARAELDLLRGLAEDAPGPVWALDGTGQLVWANRAYLALADLAHPPSEEVPPGAWPAVPLFEPPAGLIEGQADLRRHALALPGRALPEWFEVTSVRRDGGSVHFGADVGRLVGAETARTTFVQALTRTFAHLSTGLAIFDRQRRLALFNPAFADLTGLSVTFLSSRPLVHTVLDRLRESQILPEPRNYATWRDEMAALEAAAARGQYRETWALPDGRTFRVTGRPHPDGQLAFFVEDITDEIALARRVQAEMDTVRAVLDGLGEAVAVFTPAGTLSLSNAAYDALWDARAGSPGDPARPDSSRSAAEGDLVGLAAARLWDELDRWETACGPSPLWAEVRAGRLRAGTPREATLRGPGGMALAVRLVPLPGGGLSAAFRRGAKARPERPADLPLPGGPISPQAPWRAPAAMRLPALAESAGPAPEPPLATGRPPRRRRSNAPR